MRNPAVKLGSHTSQDIKAAIAAARESLGYPAKKGALTPAPDRPPSFSDKQMMQLGNKELMHIIKAGGDAAEMAYATLRGRLADHFRPRQDKTVTDKFVPLPVVVPSALVLTLYDFMWMDRPQRKRRAGRNRLTYRDRDIYIVGAVKYIAEKKGFKPTRNRTRRTVSACWIVAAALGELGINLTEAAVERIWGRAVSPI